MNEKLEDLMYRAGLTAQGCWDSMDQYDREAIMDFAKLVAAAEREECAKVCDEVIRDLYIMDGDASEEVSRCAAAIRARGEQEQPK